VRACVFTVAGAPFALPVSQVLELCPEADLTPVPGAPSRILGVFHRRGRIVPVVRLSDGKIPAGGSGLLVLECRTGTVATPVESVVGISDLDPDPTGDTTAPTLLDLDALMETWSGEVAEAFDGRVMGALAPPGPHTDGAEP
jgi:chemotaxis signal transduction protein